MSEERVKEFMTEMFNYACKSRNKLDSAVVFPLTVGLGEYPDEQDRVMLAEPLLLSNMTKGMIATIIAVASRKMPSDFIFLVCEGWKATLSNERMAQLREQGLPPSGVQGLGDAIEVLMFNLRLSDGRRYSAFRRVREGRVDLAEEITWFGFGPEGQPVDGEGHDRFLDVAELRPMPRAN